MNKTYRFFKIVSMVISIFMFVIAGACLMLGISCIPATGWNQLGIILIFPAVPIIIFTLIDFLILIDKIKGGLIYSCTITFARLVAIFHFIPAIIRDYQYEIINEHNSKFALLYYFSIAIILSLITVIPSVFNTIRKTVEHIKNK